MTTEQAESIQRMSEIRHKLGQFVSDFCKEKNYQVYTEEINMVLAEMITSYSRQQLRDQLKD
jgi:hypothetical protein